MRNANDNEPDYARIIAQLERANRMWRDIGQQLEEQRRVAR